MHAFEQDTVRTLEQLLQETHVEIPRRPVRPHAFLAGTRRAALVDGRTNARAGVTGVLTTNSQQLADRVQAGVGAPARERFLALWGAHLDAFDAYRAAAARGDAAGRTEPATALARIAQDLDALLTAGPGGAVLRG